MRASEVLVCPMSGVLKNVTYSLPQLLKKSKSTQVLEQEGYIGEDSF
jgi:hypothetical protein